MHKYLLLLVGAALALPAQAQTERGAKLLGASIGNLGYTSQGKNNRSLTGGVYPSVGWFVADRLAVGATASLGLALHENSYMGNDGPVLSRSRIWSFGLTPFARYYFLETGKHKLFAQAGIGLTRHDVSNTIRENGMALTAEHYHNTNRQWLAGPGYDYFLSPNVALEATAFYQRSSPYNTPFGGRGQGTLNLRLGLSMFLPAAGRSTE